MVPTKACLDEGANDGHYELRQTEEFAVALHNIDCHEVAEVSNVTWVKIESVIINRGIQLPSREWRGSDQCAFGKWKILSIKLDNKKCIRELIIESEVEVALLIIRTQPVPDLLHLQLRLKGKYDFVTKDPVLSKWCIQGDVVEQRRRDRGDVAPGCRERLRRWHDLPAPQALMKRTRLKSGQLQSSTAGVDVLPTY